MAVAATSRALLMQGPRKHGCLKPVTFCVMGATGATSARFLFGFFVSWTWCLNDNFLEAETVHKNELERVSNVPEF